MFQNLNGKRVLYFEQVKAFALLGLRSTVVNGTMKLALLRL